MAIKRRKLRKHRKAVAPPIIDYLDRMGDIIAAGHGVEADARTYNRLLHEELVARFRAIVDKAERLKSWDFMKGCYKQATELYVLASVLYERFPQHTIMSDGAFDALAKWLLKHREHIDVEFWKWYNVSAIGLKAGSGYDLTIRTPIVWMVYVITGETIESDGEDTPNSTGVLRQGVIGRSKRASTGGGGKSGKVLRRRKLRR
jgi:hypothetical protein